jgi:hypothetical protein
MTRADDVLNIILGACAVGYSFLPPHRVPRYRRSVALVLRVGGLILLLVAGASLALDHRASPDGRQPSPGRGTLIHE